MRRILLFITFIILFVDYLYCQESVFHSEFSFFPICYKQKHFYVKEYDEYKNKVIAGPSLLLNFPVSKKISVVSGVFPMLNKKIFAFKDSVFYDYEGSTFTIIENQVYGGFVSKYTRHDFDINIPLIIEYNVMNKKNISINAAFGTLGLFSKWYNYIEFYYHPIGDSIFFEPYRYQYTGIKLLVNSDIILTGSLEYYPFKHFGFSMRPYLTYGLFESKGYKLFGSGLGFGICYK